MLSLPRLNKLSIWQVIKSVLASFLGVQTQQNYQHDFTHSTSILPFVLVGIVMVILLILSILGVVLLVT
jgi:hypothetical protein